MKLAELRRLSDEELSAELKNAQEQLFNLRFQFATRQLKDHAALGRARRSIAQLLTVRRERELARAIEAEEKAGG